MPFELPADVMDQCNGFMYCLALWAHDVTNGLFWVFVVMGFAVVVFMATQRFGTPRSYGFASFCGLLAAIFFATMQLMPWWIASAFILNGVAGFVVMIMSEK